MKRRYAALAAALALTLASRAQTATTYPEPEAMRPGMTEYWTPQPAVVTPAPAGAPAAAPSDAIVLYGGGDLSAWRHDDGSDAAWVTRDGCFDVDNTRGDLVTRQSFGSCQLHLEWRVPANVEGSSQGRGNSGVYLQDRYEVQILDSYHNATYVNGMAASVYKQTPPLVNAMRRPGEWNVYDIIYTAPVFRADGTYLYHPYVTVIHNGVVVQNHTEIQGTTEYVGLPRVSAHGDGPLRLQAHGDNAQAMSFRNIWIRPL